jgi:aminopeptidase N
LYSHAGTLYHCSADYAFRPQQSQLTLPLAYFAYFRTPFMKKIIAGIFAFSLASVALAQHNDLMCYHNDPGRHERNRNIDVTHMKLSVSFNPAEATVFGVVTHQFRCLQDNVDTIFLDAPGITADSVWLNGKSISFRYNTAGLICNTNLNQAYNVQHSLKIKYTAKPKKGIYFIGWNVPEIDDPIHQTRRQIWTQGQGIDNRHWIPMIDDRGDKFVTEVQVTFDKVYNVLSNGQLLSNKENKDKKTRTWHYKINNRHAGYLLMLAIDKYAIKKTATKRGTPIQFWYYPEHPERLEPSSLYSERIIEFLEDETGVKYPWGSYSQVMIQDFLYGAMENTGATTFGDFFWVDNRAFLDRNYVTVNAHEATHQWFGDLITARNDADHWLQESFATYYPGLFVGSVYGPDETAWYFRGNMNGAIAAGEKNSLPVRNSEAGSARHYPKGASVLHMLQHVMGRDNFRRGIKLYLDRHAFDGVMTVDLEKAMLDATGMNMDWFFDQWIYRGGEPHYKVSRQSVTAGTEFTVEQIHKMEPTVGTFRMPVDFAVYYTDGSVSRLTVNIDKLFQKVTVPNPGNKDIAFTLFDEGSHILKKLTFEKSAEECLKQFLGARDMLDRYDALIALSKIPFEKKKDALAAAFAKETHKSIRAEITKQWLQNNEDLNFANQAIKARQTEVRRAVIEGLTVNDNTLAIFETALKDSSYFIIESALMKLWEAMPDESKRTRYLQAITGVDGYTHNLKIRYLELSTEVFPDMKGNAIMMLTDYCSDKYEFRTRILAMQALQRLNVCNEVVVKNLYTCILNFNSRLAGPAKDVLQYFKQQTACQKILKSTLETGGYSAEQKRSIKQTVGL